MRKRKISIKKIPEVWVFWVWIILVTVCVILTFILFVLTPMNKTIVARCEEFKQFGYETNINESFFTKYCYISLNGKVRSVTPEDVQHLHTLQLKNEIYGKRCNNDTNN